VGINVVLVEDGSGDIRLAQEAFRRAKPHIGLQIAPGKPFSLNPVHSARTGTEEAVRLIIRNRAERVRFLPTNLFADPAWDMLLDLYLSDILSKRTSVSSLCGASNVPMTTALRWISALDREGLIGRSQDRNDGRRSFIALSEAGLARMDDYFDSLAQ
jgi:DNA-binding MarR family transcriptional regulator